MSDTVALSKRVLATAAAVLLLVGFAAGAYTAHGGVGKTVTTDTKTQTTQVAHQEAEQHQDQTVNQQKAADATKDNHQEVDVDRTVIKKKDGTVVIKEHRHVGSDSHQQTKQTQNTQAETKTDTKVVTQIQTQVVTETKTVTVVSPQPKWKASGLVGLSVHDLSLRNGFSPGPLVYGGAVQHQFIGPIYAGVWGLSNGSFGLALTLEF